MSALQKCRVLCNDPICNVTLVYRTNLRSNIGYVYSFKPAFIDTENDVHIFLSTELFKLMGLTEYTI